MEGLIRRTRWIAAIVAVLFLASAMQAPAVQAGMISTEVLASQQGEDPHARIQSLLNREDIREQLQAWGVDPDEAKERAAALSDTEAQALAERMEEMPAGGVNVLGALVFVFIVLLITDILGYTDIFPFVQKTAR